MTKEEILTEKINSAIAELKKQGEKVSISQISKTSGLSYSMTRNHLMKVQQSKIDFAAIRATMTDKERIIDAHERMLEEQLSIPEI